MSAAHDACAHLDFLLMPLNALPVHKVHLLILLCACAGAICPSLPILWMPNLALLSSITLLRTLPLQQLALMMAHRVHSESHPSSPAPCKPAQPASCVAQHGTQVMHDLRNNHRNNHRHARMWTQANVSHPPLLPDCLPSLRGMSRNMAAHLAWLVPPVCVPVVVGQVVHSGSVAVERVSVCEAERRIETQAQQGHTMLRGSHSFHSAVHG